MAKDPVLVTWECDSYDNDAGVEESDPPDVRARKHAENMQRMCFNESLYSFTVDLGDDGVFEVDLEQDTVEKKDEHH